MESKSNKFNIKDEISKYLSFWKWIVVSVIIALLIGYIYSRYAKDIFQSTAKIKILDNSNAAFKLPSDNVSIFGTTEIGKGNEIVIMKSAKIIGQVVDRLELSTEIFSVGKIKSVEVWKDAPFKIVWLQDKIILEKLQTSFDILLTNKGYKIIDSNNEFRFGQTNLQNGIPFKLVLNNNVFLNSKFNKQYHIVLHSRKKIIETISNKIEIDFVAKQSDILSLSLQGSNQEKTSDIVNALIEIFNEDGIKDRQMVSKKTIDFVDERFKNLFNELDDIETQKANFKKDKGLTYLEADAATLMQNNNQAQAKVFETNTQMAMSGLMMDALNTTKNFDLLPANIGINNTEINSLINSYNEQVLKRNRLLSGGGEFNPIVKEITELVLQNKSNLKRSILGFQKMLALKQHENNQLKTVQKQDYGQMPYSEKGIHSIQRQQNIKESLYILLLQKREEAAINLAITNPSLKVVDYAQNSSVPIAPNRTIILLTALFLGVLVPIIIIFIYFTLDTKINSKEDITNLISDIPIIAEIPFIENDVKTIRFLDRSILSESFRILRNNINFINPVREKGTAIFVTSTIKGEGKTFVSLNLAITLSSLGKKVILIGADLRNPQLHRILNLERQSFNGITDFLCDNHDAIKKIKSKHIIDKNIDFDIIFSGKIPPNPAELLSNGRFELLLKEIKKDYDYVIVDTAPTLLVADTPLITHLADTLLYVTRANYTEKKLLEYIQNFKKVNKIKNMGIVLNNVGQKKGYGYQYSYNYGYGYGYDNVTKKNTSIKNKVIRFLKSV